MTLPRPSSEPRAGLFITIDGPSGVGKTTTITHLAQLLRADNVPVHLTAEPSRGPIGRLAHDLTDTVTGPALACLYAADRYHHLQSEVRPSLEAGRLVLAIATSRRPLSCSDSTGSILISCGT
ncbi:dTMP kinase [Kribbella sp. NPDC059898]|uniref:dTMP kinase n=1 Tax=Kribbella sp. NPDC059898 TaxID=3346995 RepID=UPI00364BF703